MSRLEEEAAPLLNALIDGRPVSPSLGGSVTLARWMLKTAVMFHLGSKSSAIIGLEFSLMRAVRIGFLSGVRVSAGLLDGGLGLTPPTFTYVEAGPAVGLRVPNGFDFRIGLGACTLRAVWLDQSGVELIDLLRGDDGLMSMLPIDYGADWTTHHWTMEQYEARIQTVKAPGEGGI